MFNAIKFWNGRLVGVSMFQRLYYSDPYQKDAKTKEYNQRFISKLKNNYRSHPGLVAVPNRLFYNHEIRTSANPGETKSAFLFRLIRFFC